jgi:peptidoglycan/xylan/chitin deacetylase (PgdA/CDA1 family)
MNRAQALGAIAAAFSAKPAAALRWVSGVPVFMYHHVNDTRPHGAIARGLTFPMEHFEAQLRWLAQRRIATLTAAELVDAVQRGHLPQNAVVLTFDDGYADAAKIVAPLLKRYNARATFFVNDGTIGLRGHVTYRDLRAMHAAGNEIGAHGMYHLDLTTLGREGQLHEAGDCVARIARFTGVRPVSYAYASGAYDATTLALMPTIGIRSAWTEHPGRVRNLEDPYEMPRLRIARHTTTGEFAAMVDG